MELTIFGVGVLTWLTFLPVLGMAAVLLLPKEGRNANPLDVARLHRPAARARGPGALPLRPLARRVNSLAGMQFVERLPWIDIDSVAWFGRIHIEYFLGSTASA